MGIADDILAATVAELEGSGIDLTNAPGTGELLSALSAGVASVMISGGQKFYAGSELVSFVNTGNGIADATITHDLGKTNSVMSILVADDPSSYSCFLYGSFAADQNSFEFRYWSSLVQTRTINYLLAYND